MAKPIFANSLQLSSLIGTRSGGGSAIRMTEPRHLGCYEIYDCYRVIGLQGMFKHARGKAAEACRSPGRFARQVCQPNCASRFGLRQASAAFGTCALHHPRRSASPKAVSPPALAGSATAVHGGGGRFNTKKQADMRWHTRLSVGKFRLTCVTVSPSTARWR